jgi:hypothetical protein
MSYLISCVSPLILKCVIPDTLALFSHLFFYSQLPLAIANDSENFISSSAVSETSNAPNQESPRNFHLNVP